MLRIALLLMTARAQRVFGYYSSMESEVCRSLAFFSRREAKKGV